MVDYLKLLDIVFGVKLCSDKQLQYICEKCWQVVNLLSRADKVHLVLSSQALSVINKGAFLPLMTCDSNLATIPMKCKRSELKLG